MADQTRPDLRRLQSRRPNSRRCVLVVMLFGVKFHKKLIGVKKWQILVMLNIWFRQEMVPFEACRPLAKWGLSSYRVSQIRGVSDPSLTMVSIGGQPLWHIVKISSCMCFKFFGDSWYKKKEKTLKIYQLTFLPKFNISVLFPFWCFFTM